MGFEGIQFYSSDYRLKMCIYLMHKLNNNKTTTDIWLYSRLAFRDAIRDIYDKNCGPYNHNITIQVRIR
jgi:hypothetical protein